MQQQNVQDTVPAAPHPAIFSYIILRYGQIAENLLENTNVPSNQALEEPGQGRVLVVDGGGSKRCALLGDNIAEMAVRNGWSVRPRSHSQRPRY